MTKENPLVLREHQNTLTVYEERNGVLVALLSVTVGAVTQAQLMYYKANLAGRIKQIEADIILKYFYGLD